MKLKNESSQSWRSKIRNRLKRLVVAGALCAAITPALRANERLFTYSYEPETIPQGMFEVEQWATWRAGRNSAVGQQDFSRWIFRTEFEYGVTDNYTVALYCNEQYETFRDPATGEKTKDFSWKGLSLENKYMVLNPATKPVGLALYLEPTYDGEDMELEQKIILGQRHGDWKWALNFTHATEWEHHFTEVKGEIEISAGLARALGKNWSIGIESRWHNNLPEYEEWADSALYLGPVLNYRHERWWATLTVMPQIWGENFHPENPDRNSSLDLKSHERWNSRLIVGVSF